MQCEESIGHPVIKNGNHVGYMSSILVILHALQKYTLVDVRRGEEQAVSSISILCEAASHPQDLLHYFSTMLKMRCRMMLWGIASHASQKTPAN